MKKKSYPIYIQSTIFISSFKGKAKKIDRIFHLKFGASISYRGLNMCNGPSGPLHSRFRRKGGALSVEFRNPFSNLGEPRPARETHTRTRFHVPSFSRLPAPGSRRLCVARAICTCLCVYTHIYVRMYVAKRGSRASAYFR